MLDGLGIINIMKMYLKSWKLGLILDSKLSLTVLVSFCYLYGFEKVNIDEAELCVCVCVRVCVCVHPCVCLSVCPSPAISQKPMKR